MNDYNFVEYKKINSRFGKGCMINGANIRYPNFSGTVTQYNKAGEVGFNVFLNHDDPAVVLMTNDGWKLKPLKDRTDPTMIYGYLLYVKINYNFSTPPIVYLVNESAQTSTLMTSQTVGTLDEIALSHGNLVLTQRQWKSNSSFGGATSGIKAYLQQGHFVIQTYGANQYSDYKIIM